MRELFAALCLLASMPCLATVLTSIDHNDWLGKLPGGVSITNDNFNYLRANADSIEFSSGVISTGFNTITPAQNLIDGERYTAIVNSDGVNGYDAITWHFPHPVFAFAADWFSMNSLDGVSVEIAGTAVFFGDILGVPGTGFLGFISDSAFQTITFTTDGGVGNEFFAVDNLRFGGTLAEPPTLLLVAVFALLVASRLSLGATVSGQEPRWHRKT